MKACVVVNKYKSDFDVNIQRGTMWGNYVGKNCDSREEAIAAFKKEFISKIKSGEINRSHLETLNGMRLGCTCKPKACHGDIIALVVNRLFKNITTLEDI
ncbi:hypothetical protein CPT_Muldoon_230 [Serratia phage Muldoon]|uniref:DUF4326 domain-containing protein n=1 Tax=Serratia phage Muldoon TaxID=2601678 RepID=A0A5P8PHL8_9CAUD|nr:hypothetical protein HYP94_gp160 [Serratia phage Muldoon]QFR56181.1 hypothetical protein CPT_Muldoon_230 [Serratia phage Muldoon]WDS61771.1 hypothetical protein [Cronobacter phage vB_Cdu_VP8]